MRRRALNVVTAISLLAVVALLTWRSFGGITTSKTYTLWTYDGHAERLVGTRTDVQHDYGIHIGQFRLPFPLLVVLSSLLPICWALAELVRRFDPEQTPEQLRTARNKCPTCGYDLRATPSRCPECGTEVAAQH